MKIYRNALYLRRDCANISLNIKVINVFLTIASQLLLSRWKVFVLLDPLEQIALIRILKKQVEVRLMTEVIQTQVWSLQNGSIIKLWILISTIQRYDKTVAGSHLMSTQYNKSMGGVDLDELIALYRINVKTKRWYISILAFGRYTRFF